MSLDPNIEAFESLENNLVDYARITIENSNSRKIWNVGVGDGSGLLESVQRITEKALNKITDFDHVIRISIPSLTNGSTEENHEIQKSVVLAIANGLNLMDEDDSKLKKMKNELEKESFYSYKPINRYKEAMLINQMKQKIYDKLGGKRCLIILEHLLRPLNDPINVWLMEGWLPLPFGRNWWVIGVPSRDVCTKIMGKGDLVLDPEDFLRYVCFEDPRYIFELELWHASKSLSTRFCIAVTRKMDILWSCLLYTQLLSPVDNHDLSLRNNKQKQKEYCFPCNGPKELIQFWISEGLFTRKTKFKHFTSPYYWEENPDILTSLEQEAEEEEKNMTTELFELANTVLQVLISHSLLQTYHPSTISVSSSHTCLIPFSGMRQLLLNWPDKRWKLLTENNNISQPNELIDKNWISFASDSCKSIQFSKPNKITTLTLRGRLDMSQSIVETLISNMPCLRVLDLSYTSIESLPLSLSHLVNLRLLSLKGCQHLKSLLLGDSCPIGSLERLEVLDFHGVPLTEIPTNVGYNKEKLYFLDLSSPTITSIPSNLFQYMENLTEVVLVGCKSLTTLPPLATLKNLETLFLSETKLISLPHNTFKKMLCLRVLMLIKNHLLETLPESLCEAQNLEVLELSETKIISLPPKTFHQMLHLRVLKLINNSLLETLPISLCEAQNLEELELNGCKRLNKIHALPTKSLRVFNLVGNDNITSLPESLARSHNLRELNVSDCQSLTEIKMKGHVSLRSFSLTHSPIRSLSLRGCQELEAVILRNLDEMEEVDLSATAIKELPPKILGLPRLRKLHIEAVPCLKRIPWHELHHVPAVFNIDQCEHVITTNGDNDVHDQINGERKPSQAGVGVHISVMDSRLFSSFDKYCLNLVERGESLQSFDILVSSCEKRKEKMGRNSGQFIRFRTTASRYYKDALLKNLTPKPPPAQQPQRRHLVIASTELYPHGLNGIMEITESLSVEDNHHLSYITNLNHNFPRMQYFRVEQCHKIIALFCAPFGEDETCNQLQDLYVSHLQKMTTLLIEDYLFQKTDFGLLKHLYLSRCPRLERIFPDNLILPSLETLKITHCDRLRTVFYNSRVDFNLKKEKRLKGLRSIRFEEVPQLLYFYEDQQGVGPLQCPEWKTLYFRGCWSLCQLPILTSPRDQRVHVDGEVSQCNEIIAQMEAKQLSLYEFKSPPPIASLKDGVENRIFLK